MAEDSKTSIKDIYDDGMAEVMKVVGSIKATADQKTVALQSSKDLTALLLAHTLAQVESRTALLTGLIVELTQVTDAVKVKPPYAGAIDRFSKLIGTATDLYNIEKKTILG